LYCYSFRFESTSNQKPRTISTTTAPTIVKNSSQHLSNQTLPKTFKLRETKNPISTTPQMTPTFGRSKLSGSTTNINDGVKVRLTSFKPVVKLEPPKTLELQTFAPCSPPPPRSRSSFERQSSLPLSPTSINRVFPGLSFI